MITRAVTPDDLTRLKTEREEADRRYNDALTALDAAIQRAADLPHLPPPPDEHQVTPLNQGWNLLAKRPGTGWRARLAGVAWRFVGPFVEAQVGFNAALVDHINRNLSVQRETGQIIASTIDCLRDRVQELAAFQSSLVLYLQQITPYIDTKDYEFAALGRRLHDDNLELIDLLDHRTVGLGGAISGVGDELAKRWESMVVREHRYEVRTASLAATHEELRSSLGIVQQATATLKRELERLRSSSPAIPTEPVTQSALSHDAAPSGKPPSPVAAPVAGSFEQAQATTLELYKYVGFEDRFRGSQEDIKGRVEEYLPFFEGASDVLDVGCGRGEFLDLLTARGISCRGLDLNHEMVEVCRARGLHVDEGDALGYLRSLPDQALGGLIAAQVVEHLQPDYLLALIDVAYHKLRPGSKIILETINPACWFAFFSSYIRDITHVRPLHPDTLSYFLQASGFQRLTVRYSAPFPEHEKLQHLPLNDGIGQTINANVEKLNALLFTYLDYAVIGERI